MPYELEKHLIEMGILPQTELEELEEQVALNWEFKDPRDPITGEVHF